MPSCFKLFWIRIKTDIWNFIEYLQVVFYYYSNRKFAAVDWFMVRAYLIQNPFRMSKEFLLKKGEKDVNTYGETPLTTMDVIAEECGIAPNDIVYELGAGRGRTCFWLNTVIGCTVYGVEYLPAFVRIAQSAKRKFQISGVKLICRDLMEVDLEKATVIYFYGTTIKENELQQLCEKLSKLSSDVKMITISFPLSAYHRGFRTIKRFTVKFPWGTTDAYLQKTFSN
ncbi:putative uncharacterized protein [Waddlia chondrophila 2032/99]|uniref:DOT1 domain-containing protein n=2 Tax=Waddlia chondrophila TaxID=71667 RepID=D6YW09_WADCW|nr:class I SAM-dependent methyltransferase [Waddlia chondrophila]ADI38320.1 conserved hypothetical protein [Waddlia chondrophila WSU 86-1044]CCB91402.1 putative uncharacterized protein [Waddlia chondrophila 2032/99]